MYLKIKKISLFIVGILIFAAIMPSNTFKVWALDDLALYLNFDGNVNDVSGNSINGTASGSPTYVEGKSGNAIKFNANTDYVSLGNPASLNFGTETDFTVGFWIRGNWVDKDPAIISNKNWSNGSNTGWQIGIYNNMLQWNYKGANGPRKDMNFGMRLNDDVWHFIVISHDRDGNASFYEDGVYKKSISIADSTGTVDSGLPIVIGQDGTQAYTYSPKCTLDDLKIWRKVLSAQEVTNLYYQGFGATSQTGTINQFGYNIYFGDIHSHTGYSDGTGDPNSAFDYAKRSGKGDFLAITDHSYNMDLVKFSTTKNKAEYYSDMSFLGVGAFEYTRPWGHMNIYKTDWLYNTGTRTDVYNKLKNDPSSIAQWNHPYEPANYDFDEYADYGIQINQNINLIEVSNFGSKNYSPFESSFQKALDKGWHVSPTAISDTHTNDWLTGYENRTAVYTTDLSNRDNLYNAIREHRVYATEDRDLKVIYSVNGSLMGSVLNAPGTYNIALHIEDPDTNNPNDKISRVEIISDWGEIVARASFNSFLVDWQTTLSSQTAKYYYAKIYTKDGQRAWTTPVWTGATIQSNPSESFAYYSFDEGSGTMLEDSWTGKLAITKGATWTTSGKKGSALYFDGIDDYVDFESVVDDISGSWTAAMWVQREDSTNTCATLLSSAKYILRAEQYNNTNKLGFTIPGTADYAFNYSLPVGDWVHVAFVGTPSGTSIYINGQLQQTINTAIRCPINKLGATQNFTLSEFFKGYIDDLKIYRKALTQAEIAELQQ